MAQCYAAKNLILAGPRSVSIFDPAPVELTDLQCNYYLTPAHVTSGVRYAPVGSRRTVAVSRPDPLVCMRTQRFLHLLSHSLTHILLHTCIQSPSILLSRPIWGWLYVCSSRAAATLPRLRELNGYVSIHEIKESAIDEAVLEYASVV